MQKFVEYEDWNIRNRAQVAEVLNLRRKPDNEELFYQNLHKTYNKKDKRFQEKFHHWIDATFLGNIESEFWGFASQRLPTQSIKEKIKENESKFNIDCSWVLELIEFVSHEERSPDAHSSFFFFWSLLKSGFLEVYEKDVRVDLFSDQHENRENFEQKH